MIERRNELVTVFGGGGFIGRYVCEYLFKMGVRLRVASRDPRRAYAIQPLGQVGQLGFVRADLTDRRSIDRAVEGARHVAEAARAIGASALVHVSAIGADPQSESAYGRSKGEGEAAVRKAFPKATIIRPSLVFGPEDELTNRFATMANLPFLPVLAAKRSFQPVYVRDLGQAIGKAALDPISHGGKVYEIGGPQVMSMVELHRAVLELSGQDSDVVELPDAVGNLLSKFGWLPGAPLTRDQWLMLQRDNVPAKGAPGLEAFGIRPTPLAAVGTEWLGRFHKGGKFAGRRINLTATN